MTYLSRELQEAVDKRMAEKRFQDKFREKLQPMERIIFDELQNIEHLIETNDPEDLYYLDTAISIEERKKELQAILA